MPSLPRLQDAKKIVIKIGSALVVDSDSATLKERWMQSLAEDVALLHRKNIGVILVSSGAIALARHRLGFKDRRLTLHEKQAAASVGQIDLAHAWSKALSHYGIIAAQLLLTQEDTEERSRYLNARETLETLHKMHCIPVINENDAIATTEIRFGDNDRLAAKIAVLSGADQLILLSDIDGLYTTDPSKDPSAKHIPSISQITPEIEAMAGDPHTGYSTGGMRTKISAAQIATRSGCAMAIARGTHINPIQNLMITQKCSWFLPTTDKISARKNWIASAFKPAGYVIIDDGACSALEEGHSLLPAGVKKIVGTFLQGDVVHIKNKDGTILGKGLVTYNATDARKIIGQRSEKFQDILGWIGKEELIHRDDMVLLTSPVLSRPPHP